MKGLFKNLKMQEDNMLSISNTYEEYCYSSDQFVWKDAKANGIKEFWMTLPKEEVVFVIDTLELIWNRSWRYSKLIATWVLSSRCMVESVFKG